MIPDDSGLLDTAARHFACFRPMWTGPRPHRICVGWTDALFRRWTPNGDVAVFRSGYKAIPGGAPPTQHHIPRPPGPYREDETREEGRSGEGRGAESVVAGSDCSTGAKEEEGRITNPCAEGISGTDVCLGGL